MSRGSDEVETGVDTCVMVAVEGALDFELLLEVSLKLGIDKLHDGLVTEKKKKTNEKSYSVRVKSIYFEGLKSFLVYNLTGIICH